MTNLIVIYKGTDQFSSLFEKSVLLFCRVNHSLVHVILRNFDFNLSEKLSLNFISLI